MVDDIQTKLGITRFSARAEWEWINKTATLDQLLPLYAFISENTNAQGMLSAEAKEFAKLAIKAIIDGEIESFDDVIVEEGPDKPIISIEDYLKCFDISRNDKLTIYVNQPIANSNATYTTGAEKAGHAFVGISQGNITRVLGFYPLGIATPFNPEDPPMFGDNSGDDYDVSLSKEISAFQLSAIINETLTYTNNYHLSTNNCTDYAAVISQLSGFDIPLTFGEWPGGIGLNPGNFGQDIRALDLNPETTRNENGGNASQNTGSCD